MDNRASKAVELLKQSKLKGLPFYQAAQQLLQQGFSQAEIDQAAVDMQYNPPKTDAENPPKTESEKEIEQEEAELEDLKNEDKLEHHGGPLTL